MTGDDLKRCNEGDSGENRNTYFPEQACKCNFCIIPSFILLIHFVKTKKVKPPMNML